MDTEYLTDLRLRLDSWKQNNIAVKTCSLGSKFQVESRRQVTKIPESRTRRDLPDSRDVTTHYQQNPNCKFMTQPSDISWVWSRFRPERTSVVVHSYSTLSTLIFIFTMWYFFWKPTSKYESCSQENSHFGRIFPFQVKKGQFPSHSTDQKLYVQFF